MKIKKMMRKRVVTVSPEDTIVKVLMIFSKKHISGVPVMKGGELVGIITDSDIIAKLDIHTRKVHFASSPDFLLIMAGLKSRRGMDEIEKEMQVMKKFRVRDFMTEEVFTIGPEDTITDAARIIHEKGVTRLPVVDKGKLIGIVARQDLIRALSRC